MLRKPERWRAYPGVEPMRQEAFSHGCGQLAFHVVLVPKYRRDIFRSDTLARKIEDILREIASRYNMTFHALKVMPDHVHIFVGIHPSMSVSRMFQCLKGVSSYELFRDFPQLKNKYRTGHLWSKGKFFRSVGSVTDSAVKHYIEESYKNQRPPSLDTPPFRVGRRSFRFPTILC